jgi:hypothetical protein
VFLTFRYTNGFGGKSRQRFSPYAAFYDDDFSDVIDLSDESDDVIELSDDTSSISSDSTSSSAVSYKSDPDLWDARCCEDWTMRLNMQDYGRFHNHRMRDESPESWAIALAYMRAKQATRRPTVLKLVPEALARHSAVVHLAPGVKRCYPPAVAMYESPPSSSVSSSAKRRKTKDTAGKDFKGPPRAWFDPASGELLALPPPSPSGPDEDGVMALYEERSLDFFRPAEGFYMQTYDPSKKKSD